MERLNTRTFFFAGMLAVIGAVILLTPTPKEISKTEQELEKLAPTRVMGVTYEVGGRNPEQSYQMEQSTYDILKPFGIVCRVFMVDGDRYDTVLVASRSKDSFHDPRVCFSGQGWNIEKFEPASVPTKTRGTVPAMVIETYSDVKRKQLAAFLYRGPGGFYGSTQSLKLAFLGEQLRLGNNLDGVFYRFIPNFQNEELPIEEQRSRLIKFIGEFLDAANESSGGYF